MKFFVKKEKKAKDPLLQTYFVSLLSLVLCVGMFMGTTFAWFSSDVTSADNQIFVGSLDVTMSHSADGQNWTPISKEVVLADDGTNPNLIIPEGIFWEPGYTLVKWLKVGNNGSLGFNYRLKMAGGNATVPKVLQTMGPYFTVYVNTAETIEKPASIEALQSDANWVEVGSLLDVMAGKSLLYGSQAVGDGDDVFAIAIHMKADTPAVLEDTNAADGIDAPFQVMGAKLEGINVKLEAWQAAGDEDSLGNDYDNLISNAEELKNVLVNGGKAVLEDDIKVSETLYVMPNKPVLLDLNGKTLSMDGIDQNRLFKMEDDTNLTIVANGGTVELGSYGLVEFPADTQNASLTLEGGTYEGTLDNGALIRLRAASSGITVNLKNVNTKLENGWVISTSGVYEDTMTLNVEGGTFEAMIGFQLLGSTAAIKDTTIKTQSFAVLGGQLTMENATVEVTNAGSYGDTPGAIAVSNGDTFTIKDSTVSVKGMNNSAALIICSSGGHFALEKVAITTTDPVKLFTDTTPETGSSSVVYTEVTHNGATVANGQ